MLKPLVLAAGYIILAHSWYDTECCGEKDCHVYPTENVHVTPRGYQLADGEIIAFVKARVSKDQDYHRCDYDPRFIMGIGEGENSHVRCFYAPRGNS